MSQPTLGAQRVRLDFNPSSDTAVDRIKRAGAALIDAVDDDPGDSEGPRHDRGRGGRHVGRESGHSATAGGVAVSLFVLIVGLACIIAVAMVIRRRL